MKYFKIKPFFTIIILISSDPRDVALVVGIFDAAKTIARLKLTETELALYQSLVLLWPGMANIFLSLYSSPFTFLAD